MISTASRARTGFLFSAIAGISLLHFFTPLHFPQLHDIYQRLYYLPIILGAFWFGIRGGLITSLAVSLVYVPHLLFQWHAHVYHNLEKFLEIVLFNVVGGITGYLSQREAERRQELARTAAGLEDSYRKLQGQAELIIRIEEQLRRAERLSVLGEVSAALAHEIRNPLGSIRGTAEILSDDFPRDNPKYEFLQILLKETDRLNGVVENFLNLARAEGGDWLRFDLREELREVVSLASRDATSRGLSVVLSAEVPVWFRGDRDKLRQAFLNLVLNALQACGESGRVTVSLKAPGESSKEVEISVSDTGPGIAREDRTRIFEPFFTTRRGGTGLGLAITQKIIFGHGGRIEVEGEEGEGACFWVFLPVRDGENGDE